MIRSIRPTDFASLLAFLRTGKVNDAKTGRNLGRSEGGLFSVGRFFKEWLSLDENRYTWIETSRGRIRGLISVRSRPSPITWQVDSLILDHGSDSLDICLRLLEYVSAVGSENGIHKVFLRVEKDSRLTEVARQAIFLPYKSELLFGRDAQPGTVQSTPTDHVRPKRPADDLNLFHLYSAAVPGHVRQAEAMTFDEWKAISRKHLSLYTQRELVIDRDGSVAGWLRVRKGRQANFFDILTLPQQKETIDELLDHCLSILDQSRPTYCLLPEFRDDLRRALEDRRFGLMGEYSSLVKQLAVRIRQPRLAPVRI